MYMAFIELLRKPRTCSYSGAMASFLGFGKLLVLVAFLIDFVRHAASFDAFFLTNRGSISIQRLSGIGLIDERIEFL